MLSGELKKRSANTASTNPDPATRPALPTLARDTGAIQMFSLVGSKDQIEQARPDREVRKTRLQLDLSYDF